jgi:hypothetical protein
MTKLTIDPQVLAKLRQAHPTPASSAARLLDKYVTVLQGLIGDAMQQNRSAFMRKRGIYSVNVSTLHRCGQFGLKRTRLHKWLEENDLALIKIVEVGNNLSSANSWVQLTKLVTFTDDLTVAGVLQQLTDAEIDQYLAGGDDDEEQLLARLYPELEQEFTSKQFAEKFDYLLVDQQSLQNHITWLLTEATLLNDGQRELFARQAKTILAVTRQLGGKYLQRKKYSEFGRTYYDGLSVQNVNKELRRAMLGDCWEYDVRSSVVAWKMSFAEEYLQSMGLQQEVKRAFSTTLWYLQSKAEFMQQVQDHTFDDTSNVPPDLQPKLIKAAITALCFGAKLTKHGWRTSNDGWQNPALADIIKNETERTRFMACRDVRDFVREQSALDTFIYKCVELQEPNLLKLDIVRASKRPSKAKVIAYLYQNAEAQAMAKAYEFLKGKKIGVLAKIHDAFIVRKQLSQAVKHELEELVQFETHNEYWRLGEKQLKRWGDLQTQEEKQRIAQHKAFIANEVEYMREKAKQRKQ